MHKGQQKVTSSPPPRMKRPAKNEAKPKNIKPVLLTLPNPLVQLQPRPWNPDGIVLALQFWSGDQEQAFRLARLMADLEPVRRNDVALYFCCDDNTPQTDDLLGVQQYCGQKFPVGAFQSKRIGLGYPGGPNVLWASCMEFFYRQWVSGKLKFESVFTMEADAAPLRRDYLDELISAQRETLRSGKLITGALMDRHYYPHTNGNLIAHVSLVRNYPELLDTPADVAWDMHHHVTLRALTRPSGVIINAHRSNNFHPDALNSMANTSAWLHGCRDDTVYDFARALLPRKAAKPTAKRPPQKGKKR